MLVWLSKMGFFFGPEFLHSMLSEAGESHSKASHLLLLLNWLDG